MFRLRLVLFSIGFCGVMIGAGLVETMLDRPHGIISTLLVFGISFLLMMIGGGRHEYD